MLDLYQDQVRANVEPLRPVQDVEPGAFANFFSGARDVGMAGLAKTARAGSMAMSVPSILEDRYYGGTAAQDRYFKWHDEVFGRAVDYWTPKPNEVGVAGEVVGSLLGMLPLIFANPSAAVAATQLGAAEDLARKYPDVSATRANLVGGVQAAGLGLGIWMPILGRSLAQRVLVGGAGFNLAQGAVMRGASGQILEGTKAVEEFQAFDPKALTIDALLGLAFGGMAHLSRSQRAQGEHAWQKLADWAQSLKPSEIDALLVLREGQHINQDTLPGKPATSADATVHVDRVREAIDQLAKDQPVAVEDIKVNVSRETSAQDGAPAVGEVTRDPQFEVDQARVNEMQRQAAMLMNEAERVRLEEGLPRMETQETRPPADITALDPVAQSRAVGQHIERQLVDAGMQRKEAVANAAVWEAFAKSAHERYGVPPAELMAKWGVDVRRMDSADNLLGPLATGNRGTFDPNNPNILFQSEARSPWYSELARQVDYLKVKEAPAQGWKDTIKGLVNKGLVKRAELEAIGFNDWLDLQEGKVTKQQVQDFIAQNGVRVEEVELGGVGLQIEIVEDGSDKNYPFAMLVNGVEENRFRNRDAAEEEAELFRNDPQTRKLYNNPTKTKFDKYQLPGGENYRELLLTLPERGKVTETKVVVPRGWGDTDGGNIGVGRTGGEEDFRSSHFDQPNILAHIRFNERTDADGKRVLFIEEIQSDWAQRGKKVGFRVTPEREAQLRAKVAEIEALGREASPEQKQEWVNAMNELQPQNIQLKPHSAPFVGKTEAWVALSLKRMIRYAAENGFDRVAWTNGEQQAARYDLSKHIKQVDAAKMRDGYFMVVAAGNDGRTVIEKAVTEDALPEVLGKELATKIVNDGGGTYSGLDLKVGGEGMTAFYDKIVPNVANDVLKKLGGGRVGDVRIVYPDSDAFLSQEERFSVARDRGDIEAQPGFDITPELRAKALEGMPLFQGNERGAVSFDTGRTLISLFEKADKSTFQHETGHVFLEMTKDMASRPDAPIAAAQDWATIANWLKIEGGNITREAHEQWARGWEKYLAEGVAPNEGLKAAFKRFRDWLIDIYKSVVNIDAPLNNQIRGVMARMLESQAKDPIAKGGLDDPRLQTQEYRQALEMMARESGWAEEGGRLIRNKSSDVAGEETISRTKWIPHAEWYQRMQQDPNANLPGGRRSVEEAVRKAIMGETMSAQERRAVTWMLDEHKMLMDHWAQSGAETANPDRDPFSVSNAMHAEGVPATDANVLDIALIDRARQIDPDALENIPVNSDDATFMAAVREIVDADQRRVEAQNQGGQTAAETGQVAPRADAGTGTPPPPRVEAGGKPGDATGMLASEARRIAELNPDIRVPVGTDAAGQPVYKTLNEILDEAAMESELARQDAGLFAVAAECLLGVI